MLVPGREKTLGWIGTILWKRYENSFKPIKMKKTMRENQFDLLLQMPVLDDVSFRRVQQQKVFQQFYIYRSGRFLNPHSGAESWGILSDQQAIWAAC